MKKLSSYAPFLILALLAFLYFTKGGNPVTALTDFVDPGMDDVSEQQIRQDILANNEDLRFYDFDITGIDLVTSQNDKDLQQYTCTAEYTAENSSAVYFGTMALTYNEYDKAWQLSTAMNEGTWFKAKDACPEDIPIAVIQDVYRSRAQSWQSDFTASRYPENYKEVALDFALLSQNSVSDNDAVFTYEVSGRESSVCSWTETWRIECSYTLDEEWHVEDSEKSRTAETWDVCGRYTCVNSDINATVDIISITLEPASRRATITTAWEFTSYMDTANSIASPNVTYGSGGRVTDVVGFDSGDQYIALGGSYITIYICGRYGQWDANGDKTEGVGVWLKVHGITSLNSPAYWLYK